MSRWKSEGECAVYELEAPGLRDDELSVTVEGSLLTLEGKHEASDLDGYILRRKERPLLRFRRQFSLHRDLDPGAVTAELKDGILRILVAKRAPGAARKIAIQAPDSEVQDV
jgi:HSP20 family protein